MSKPMELLNEPAFWLYYQKGDDEGLDQGLLQKYFDFRHQPDENHECDPLVITLDCLDNSFVLDVYVDFYAINCWFQVPGDKTEYQIGWWDFGQWHPFGMTWDELLLVWESWKANPEQLSVSPDQALLLLAKFVGMGGSELSNVPARKQIIKSAYARLGLDFDFKQINELASCTFLLPSDDDYEWSEDANLGRVFSGKYPCYSLRNSHHVSGEEGIFSFRPVWRFDQEAANLTFPGYRLERLLLLDTKKGASHWHSFLIGSIPATAISSFHGYPWAPPKLP